MEKLRVEALFASSPFYLRYESAMSPFHRIGEKWDSHGSYIGVAWELARSCRQRLHRKNWEKAFNSTLYTNRVLTL